MIDDYKPTLRCYYLPLYDDPDKDKEKKKGEQLIKHSNKGKKYAKPVEGYKCGMILVDKDDEYYLNDDNRWLKPNITRGEIYLLDLYFFSDDCRPIPIAEELASLGCIKKNNCGNKCFQKMDMDYIKHCLMLGFFKDDIIDYYLNRKPVRRTEGSGKASQETIEEYWLRKRHPEDITYSRTGQIIRYGVCPYFISEDYERLHPKEFEEELNIYLDLYTKRCYNKENTEKENK